MDSKLELPTPLEIGTVNRNCSLLFHDGAAGGNNRITVDSSNLFYNGNSNTLSVRNLDVAVGATIKKVSLSQAPFSFVVILRGIVIACAILSQEIADQCNRLISIL